MIKRGQVKPMYFARWTDDRTKPQQLWTHLENVSQRTKRLAERARGSDVAFVAAAKVAGFLNDLGKYRLEFQEYLNVGDSGRRSAETDHSIYGAAASGVAWNALVSVGRSVAI